MADIKNISKIELLAPAGDYDCFLAAIKAGADAVYIGGSRFGARAYAANFTQDEVLEATDHAHLHGRKLYLTVNTLLKNTEIKDLYDYMKPLYEGGIDGVIVQDAGVIRTLSEFFPDLPLHASTQMAVTGVEGVRLLEELGIKRVVPARELSLDEIKKIYDMTGMELECFIHGALCYSYSGKCLFSSIVGGRSGNRGRCAGPCRLPYDGKYILSARDISAIEILPELIQAGIASFKIEGRMKSREYVAGVTGIYRKYTDRYFDLLKKGKEEEYRIEEDDLKELNELYTRSGHCTGYYHKHNGGDMISVDKPCYDTADDDRMKSLYDKYTGKGDKLKCRGYVRAYAGENLYISIEYGENKVEFIGSAVDKAIKQPTDENNIRKHLCKTGDTPYEFFDLRIDAGDDIFIPVSVLNSIRREAFDLLTRKLTLPYRRICSAMKDEPDTEEHKNKRHERSPKINVKLDSLMLLSTVLESPLADIITVDINEFIIRDGARTRIDEERVREVSDMVRRRGAEFDLTLPAVIRHGFFVRFTDIEGILNSGLVDGVIIDNYESMYFLKEIGFRGRVTGDVHMYCMNDRAADVLLSHGLSMFTYPVELNSGELNHLEIKRGEFILYGRAPMMISAQCINKTNGKCAADNGVTDIKDRYGNVFPVSRNCNECYNTILNCIPTMIASMKEIPSGIAPYSYRIHFTVEDKTEAEIILDYYRAMFAGEEKDIPVKRTLLHLKRGVQ